MKWRNGLPKSVAVVDYGAGNTLNVVRAFDGQGLRTELVSTPEQLNRFSHVVLPGVGAFDFGIKSLIEKRFAEVLVRRVANGDPVLGICLGMQLFAQNGQENGFHHGLGLIQGTVAHLDEPGSSETETRVPNTGWSVVHWREAKRSLASSRLRTGYFNHSYFLMNAHEDQLLATTMVGGREVPAVVGTGSLSATQFHPEKSGRSGLELLRGWVLHDGFA